MAPGKYCNPKIVASFYYNCPWEFMFSFKKSRFTLEFQMLRGQNVCCLLATSFKILVANTQFLVALVTNELQFWTLKSDIMIYKIVMVCHRIMDDQDVPMVKSQP